MGTKNDRESRATDERIKAGQQVYVEAIRQGAEQINKVAGTRNRGGRTKRKKV